MVPKDKGPQVFFNSKSVRSHDRGTLLISVAGKGLDPGEAVSCSTLVLLLCIDVWFHHRTSLGVRAACMAGHA